jgi:hypothetical protein
LAPKIDVTGNKTGQEGALILTPSTTAFDGMVQCGVGVVPRGCLNGHLFNPAPRLGFAWDPLGNGKMAVRGGYGIFFEHTNGQEANSESLEASPPLVQEPTQYNIVGYNNVGGQGIAVPAIDRQLFRIIEQWPYVQQWHLDVQRDLIKNTLWPRWRMSAPKERISL